MDVLDGTGVIMVTDVPAVAASGKLSVDVDTKGSLSSRLLDRRIVFTSRLKKNKPLGRRERLGDSTDRSDPGERGAMTSPAFTVAVVLDGVAPSVDERMKGAVAGLVEDTSTMAVADAEVTKGRGDSANASRLPPNSPP